MSKREITERRRYIKTRLIEMQDERTRLLEELETLKAQSEADTDA